MNAYAESIALELQGIADELEMLEQRGQDRLWKEEGSVLELVAQADALIRSVLGEVAYDVKELAEHRRRYDIGLDGGDPFSFSMWVASAAMRIRSAQSQIERAAKPQPAAQQHNEHRGTYVSIERINQLAALNSSRFDYAKLAQLCRELNVVYEKDCHFAVAMLVRAILDHVPPIFGVERFRGVAFNYKGSKSFNKHMQSLETSLRNIADGCLHEEIRRRETLPTVQDVDFRSAVSSLLGEVIRIEVGSSEA